jgi:hypothetical protein
MLRSPVFDKENEPKASLFYGTGLIYKEMESVYDESREEGVM